LLKIAPNFKKYISQKLKLEKPNTITKVISEPSVATMIETNFKIDIAAIKKKQPHGNYPNTSWEEHC
jgi:hypothetical protein